MYTITKIKHIAISSFLFFSGISYGQTSAGASTITSQNSNGFSIGFYGGPNITRAKPSVFDNSSQTAIYTGNGYDYTLIAKLGLYKGFFFSTGISYEKQSYQTNNNISSEIIFPQFNIPLKVIIQRQY